MVNCVNYQYYSHWADNLSRSELMVCMDCSHAFVSQYEKADSDHKGAVK